MKKPQIIILMHYLELGGAEISLIGLLNALDPNKVDVDLFIYSHQGELMKYIPNWVNLLPEIKSYSLIEKPVKEVIKRGKILLAWARIKSQFEYKKYRRSYPVSGEDIALFQFLGNNIVNVLPSINSQKDYDLCISFLLPHNIGNDKVKAKKKLAWIHTDYSTVHINRELELPVWSAYDYIASISTNVTEGFVKTFPSLKGKIVEIENILSPDFVSKRAEEFSVENEISNNGINLVSVGRYTHAKNYDNVPDIAKRIYEKGITKFKWYIIGYGGDEQLIRQKIEEAGMQDHVILLGKKENPYPYIKACDIYIQPSRYEGKSVTVREAQILCKPVIITEYPTARSQVRDGLDGIIVPMDNEGCAKGIVDLINNKEKQQELSENCSRLDFGNQSEVEKIYKILGV